MKKLWIIALCLVMVLTFAACGESPAPSTPNEEGVTTTTTAAEGNNTTGGEGADATTTTTTLPAGNVVDGNDFFGETTTTTKNDGSTTTVAPPVQEEIANVKVPAAGYDMDGKKRIVLKASEVKKENGNKVAYFTFANVSKDNGREWIIPEYSKIQYACYDKNGKEIYTGEFVLGALDYGKTSVRPVQLPSGTAELKFTGHNLEYWTPWG